MNENNDVTEGSLLNGAIAYRQLRTGFRTGLEPVLLAAAIPARAGERVLEAGTGPGAGLLCLAHRVPGIQGTGVEKSSDIATLARQNVQTNHLENRLSIITQDILDFAQEMSGSPSNYDHVFANPPWHEEASSPSPVALRDQAKRRHAGLVSQWVQALGSMVRPRGSISLILPAALISEAMTSLREAKAGEISLYPLWPKAERRAKIIIVRGIKAARGPDRVESGLMLHQEDGSFTPQAHEILRYGKALAF
ncbi:tRNA1(Val) (adenine(37)-N6)-methyltransferase [Granulibacter bethesdensis]|uniref:tRNA1(Val) (adenine(37)-N6)-methyltransferase n=1 Tax=Granulibacter bethesdensis TaxID=364410 RepID=UPI0003F216C3|nr:methyltransferase [Granulibacter bethesdensis]AHJ66719.1 Methyltransferase [Granulibacter bethesdensis CGDNIH4]